jgi:hypothetical protein
MLPECTHECAFAMFQIHRLSTVAVAREREKNETEMNE